MEWRVPYFQQSLNGLVENYSLEPVELIHRLRPLPTKWNRKGGEDAMAKQRIWMPSYVYAYNPWYGYYPYQTWQEYEVLY